MLYRKPFSVILEDAVEPGVVTELPQPLEEPELIQEVGEAGELKTEITQDSSDVEEALEEAEALAEQVVATDEVLAKTADEENNTTDENTEITEEQVVTAEESFKWTLAKLGVASGYARVVSTAQESLADKKTRRERLKICNESIKEFLGKLIQSIINLAKQIASRIVMFVKKNIAVFANYKKQIENIEEKFKEIDTTSIDGKQLVEEIGKKQNLITQTYFIHSCVYKVWSCQLDIELLKTTVKKITDSVIDAAKSKDESKFTSTVDSILEFIAKSDSKTKGLYWNKGLMDYNSSFLSNKTIQEISNAGGIDNIISVGVNAFYILSDGKVKKVVAEFGSDFIDKVKLDVDRFIKSITNISQDMKKAAEDIKKVASTRIAYQEEVEKELKRIETSIKTEGFNAAKGIHAIKSIGIDISMDDFNFYVESIKEYVRAANIVIELASKK